MLHLKCHLSITLALFISLVIVVLSVWGSDLLPCKLYLHRETRENMPESIPQPNCKRGINRTRSYEESGVLPTSLDGFPLRISKFNIKENKDNSLNQTISCSWPLKDSTGFLLNDSCWYKWECWIRFRVSTCNWHQGAYWSPYGRVPYGSISCMVFFWIINLKFEANYKTPNRHDGCVRRLEAVLSSDLWELRLQRLTKICFGFYVPFLKSFWGERWICSFFAGAFYRSVQLGENQLQRRSWCYH